MRLFAGLLLFAGIASAQTVPTINPGEPFDISWTQELTCTDGTAAAAGKCQLTGYFVQIEREPTFNVWNNVGTTPLGPTARTWKWIANGLGQACFRLQALNPAGYPQSDPSNIKCVKVLPPAKLAIKPPVLTSSKD